MTIDKFRCLTRDDKIHIALNACYLSYKVVSKETESWLYFTNGFFIEVYYNRTKKDDMMITCFDGMACELLKCYVQVVELTDLNEVLGYEKEK